MIVTSNGESIEHYDARMLFGGLAFADGPRWHDGRLWYSDFYRRAIFSLDLDGAEERLELEVPGQPSGLGWLPEGDLLYVSMTDQRVQRRHGDAVALFCDLAPYCGFWANELLVAPSGASYVGNFGFDLDATLRDGGVEALVRTPPPTTNLVVLDPTGEVLQVVPQMAFPNGTAISPDGATLVVGETMANRVSAFDVAADGSLDRRRVFAQFDAVAVDGLCLDAEGQVWLANALTNECVRVREGGEVTAVVTTSQRAFACVLGGPARTTLFVLTAPTSSRFRAAQRRDGRVEVAEVAVAGAGTP